MIHTPINEIEIAAKIALTNLLGKIEKTYHGNAHGGPLTVRAISLRITPEKHRREEMTGRAGERRVAQEAAPLTVNAFARVSFDLAADSGGRE